MAQANSWNVRSALKIQEQLEYWQLLTLKLHVSGRETHKETQCRQREWTSAYPPWGPCHSSTLAPDQAILTQRRSDWRAAAQRVRRREKDHTDHDHCSSPPTAYFPIWAVPLRQPRGAGTWKRYTVTPWCPRGMGARTHLGYQNPSMLMSLTVRA